MTEGWRERATDGGFNITFILRAINRAIINIPSTNLAKPMACYRLNTTMITRINSVLKKVHVSRAVGVLRHRR